jgi:3'-phosphoadenosine 5'-phosphosulfate sulfotransferase (PAPS reductase)/FAD synthetase
MGCDLFAVNGIDVHRLKDAGLRRFGCRACFRNRMGMIPPNASEPEPARLFPFSFIFSPLFWFLFWFEGWLHPFSGRRDPAFGIATARQGKTS